jgi:ribosomal protein L37E
MVKLSTIWKNKTSIIEGIKNNMFKKEHVEEVYNHRLDICKSCTFYDPKGQSEKAVFKGSPSCGACGCPLSTKLRSLSTECGLTEVGETPLWGPVVDEETEEKIEKQIK